MFKRNLKNNLKNEIMRDDKIMSDMFNLIIIIIDFNDKLYKRIIKKKYDKFRKRVKIFFKLTIEY